MPRTLIAYASLAVAFSTACGPASRDIERHLDRGRYVRALRVARRADDAGQRIANEMVVAERLVARLEGELRIEAEPTFEASARLGQVPPAYAAGSALPLRLDVRVARAEPVAMSFRVLGLSHGRQRFLRASECPPPEAVGLGCVDWLAGAPMAPTCWPARPGDSDRTAAGIVRWMSGGLVNVPPTQEAAVCAREPVAIPAAERAGLEAAARRLHQTLSAAPSRVVAGGRYTRDELVYLAAEGVDESALWLEVAFHVDRRAAPVRQTGRIALPEAATVASGLEAAFAQPVSLSAVFRVAAPGQPYGTSMPSRRRSASVASPSWRRSSSAK